VTAVLCRTRPPEYWETGNAGNQLALLICGRCSGCPDDDPDPHGVIRQGVAFSDFGNPLPPCSNCGAPNTTYTGGDPSAKRCKRCAEPQVWIPDRREMRSLRVLSLSREGLTAKQIAAELGTSLNTVWSVRGQARKAEAA
jgi:hypothetical protein